MEVLGTVIVSISLLVVFLLFGYRAPWNASRKAFPPGSLGLPIIGDTLKQLRALKRNDPWRFLEGKRARYGPVFKMSLFGSTMVVLPAPAGNKLVFSSEEKLLRNSWPWGFQILQGPGSLTAKCGDDFKRLKKVFMTFLKPEALQRYVPRVSKLTLEHLGKHWDGKREQVVFPTMKRFIFSIACSMFMSLDTEEEQVQLQGPFNTWTKGLTQLPLNIPGTKFYEALRSRKAIHQLLDEVIQRRQQELVRGSVSEASDILSVMMSSKQCSVDEIKDNLLLLLFAGHDTAASALTVAIKFLFDHPFWKDQVHQENLAIARGKAQDNYTLDWEDLKSMKVTWRVFLETLRLQPPIFGAFRDVIQDFEFGGYTIPKGWKVYWTPASHRDGEFFEEPNKFDPSRFEGEGPAPFTFVPFGGGPRMCPGNEFARVVMMVLMHHLILKFNWELEDPAEEFALELMPTPKKGLRVKLHSLEASRSEMSST